MLPSVVTDGTKCYSALKSPSPETVVTLAEPKAPENGTSWVDTTSQLVLGWTPPRIPSCDARVRKSARSRARSTLAEAFWELPRTSRAIGPVARGQDRHDGAPGGRAGTARPGFLGPRPKPCLWCPASPTPVPSPAPCRLGARPPGLGAGPQAPGPALLCIWRTAVSARARAPMEPGFSVSSEGRGTSGVPAGHLSGPP